MGQLDSPPMNLVMIRAEGCQLFRRKGHQGKPYSTESPPAESGSAPNPLDVRKSNNPQPQGNFLGIGSDGRVLTTQGTKVSPWISLGICPRMPKSTLLEDRLWGIGHCRGRGGGVHNTVEGGFFS